MIKMMNLFENLQLMKESQTNLNFKEIDKKLDKFAGQITIDKQYEQELKKYLNKKHVSYLIDDRKLNKLTFKLKYENLQLMKEQQNNLKSRNLLNEAVSRDEVGKKLEKEFPKLTKKYFGKEIKVVFTDASKDNSFGGCVGYLYPEEYNEETEEYDREAVKFFRYIGQGDWISGDDYPKNFSDFIDELEKIGVRRLEYASDWRKWKRLYIYYMEPGTNKLNYTDIN